jgi:DNA-binding transcriptional regulator YiaG
VNFVPALQRQLAASPANDPLVVNAVIQARRSTGLSQAEFALALGISKRTLQEWEQGRRAPSGAAQALIRIARTHPAIVRDALTDWNST